MNILIIGPQGCGKGTQAQKLVEKYGFKTVEMGELLRDIAKQPTELGEMIRQINERKEMSPDSVVLDILDQELEKIESERGVIFDGIPRMPSQIAPFEEIMAKHGRKVDKVLFINISPEESTRRISKRYHCEKCRKPMVLGKDFHSIKESCDICNGKITQRGDDTPDGIKKRLTTFAEKTMPVVEYYMKKGLAVEIDGELPENEVFAKIVSNLETQAI